MSKSSILVRPYYRQRSLTKVWKQKSHCSNRWWMLRCSFPARMRATPVSQRNFLITWKQRESVPRETALKINVYTLGYKINIPLSHLVSWQIFALYLFSMDLPSEDMREDALVTIEQSTTASSSTWQFSFI